MVVRRLGSIDSVPEGGCREYDDGSQQGLFVVRTVDGVYVYRNRCPHRGISLNWMPGDFLSPDARFIRCSTHGALFRLEDGVCVFGPCSGQSLEPLPVVLHAGEILVQTEDPS